MAIHQPGPEHQAAANLRRELSSIVDQAHRLADAARKRTGQQGADASGSLAAQAGKLASRLARARGAVFACLDGWMYGLEVRPGRGGLPVTRVTTKLRRLGKGDGDSPRVPGPGAKVTKAQGQTRKPGSHGGP